MERKIGEVFNFKNIKLKVKEAEEERYCVGCYFLNEGLQCCDLKDTILGFCCDGNRSDLKSVIFQKVNE